MLGLGVLVGVPVQLGVTVALAWWGARVGRARGGAWRHLAWLPLASFALGALGVVLTLVGLVLAFHGVADADPVEKSKVLSEGISLAMGATLATAPLALLIDLVALSGCVLGTVLAPRPPPA